MHREESLKAKDDKLVPVHIEAPMKPVRVAVLHLSISGTVLNVVHTGWPGVDMGRAMGGLLNEGGSPPQKGGGRL